MTLRSDILDVARELGSGTHEDIVVRCFERWPERFGFLPSRRIPDSTYVYKHLVGEGGLIARGLLAYDGPKRWRLADDSAVRAIAAAKLAALLDARAHRLAADMIREREALVIPRTWGECVERGLPARCPHERCRHHLYAHDPAVTHERDVEPDEPPPSLCTLDIASRGEHTLEQVGQWTGVTRERIRQIEAKALRKLGLVPAAMLARRDLGNAQEAGR